MTAPRRRGGGLLVGLAVGALLIGLSSAVGGTRPGPAGLDAALSSTTGASSAAPSTTGTAADPTSTGGTGAAPAVVDAAGAGSPGGPAPAGGSVPAASGRPRLPAPATTTRAIRTTTPRAASTGLSAAEQQVVTLTNAERAQAGCAPLSVDARLTAAAREHSTDMATNDYFDHDSPDGRSFSDRETAAGYPDPGGENIAYGQQSASEVMNDWMNSDGHRRNILDCSFTTIGVGLATHGMYWTQDFGR